MQLALLLPLCVLLVLLSLFLLRKRPFAVSQQSTWTSSSIITVLYDARRTSMHSYIPACCCAVCCYTAVDAAADDVRHRVPDCKIRFRGSLHLIPVFFSFHLNKIYFQCTPWHYCRILSVHFFPYNSYHTSSVLRACAEPRRASAHLGEAPLVLAIYSALPGVEQPRES